VLHFVQLHGMKTEVPVGEAAATIAQFPVYARQIRSMGFRVALVGQDGMEQLLEQIEWSLVDAIFLGGSTEWKVGAGARPLVAEARRRRVHVHMGRVNSYKRLQYAQDIGCHTADGTFLAYAPLDRLLNWLDRLQEAA
jgi:hypothetical protein